MRKIVGNTLLTPLSISSPISYELHGDEIIGKFMGLIPVTTVHVAAVCYLRLATRSEMTRFYFLLNWIHFLSFRRSRRPVYVLRTRSGHRLFLKLEGGAHFRLRQAIGRHNEKRSCHKAA